MHIKTASSGRYSSGGTSRAASTNYIGLYIHWKHGAMAQTNGSLKRRKNRQLANGLAYGIRINGKATKDYRICPMGKQAIYRLPFGKEGSRASEVLQLVHSHINAQMEDTSRG